MHGSVALLRRGRKVLAAVGVLLVVAAIYYVYRNGSSLSSLAGLGYPGVAILMFLTSSTVVLPAPGFAAVLAAGTVWNPLLVGISGGFGAATGELTGYLLGMGGTTVLGVKEGKNWARMNSWLERRGSIAILALAFFPNPFIDVLGMAAGSVGYPIKRFWILCLIGKTAKFIIMAYLSDVAVEWWTLGH